jgi:hypothetical protein
MELFLKNSPTKSVVHVSELLGSGLEDFGKGSNFWRGRTVAGFGDPRRGPRRPGSTSQHRLEAVKCSVMPSYVLEGLIERGDEI